MTANAVMNSHKPISIYMGNVIYLNSGVFAFLRSRASRILIQLGWYARVLFSGCTVNFHEPIDLLRKSITVLPAKRVHLEKIVYNFRQTLSMFKIS